MHCVCRRSIYYLNTYSTLERSQIRNQKLVVGTTAPSPMHVLEICHGLVSDLQPPPPLAHCIEFRILVFLLRFRESRFFLLDISSTTGISETILQIRRHRLGSISPHHVWYVLHGVNARWVQPTLRSSNLVQILVTYVERFPRGSCGSSFSSEKKPQARGCSNQAPSTQWATLLHHPGDGVVDDISWIISRGYYLEQVATRTKHRTKNNIV